MARAPQSSLAIFLLLLAASEAAPSGERNTSELRLYAEEGANPDYEGSEENTNRLIDAIEKLTSVITSGFERRRQIAEKRNSAISSGFERQQQLAEKRNSAISSISDKLTLVMKSVHCPPPWEIFRNFCLLLDTAQMTWTAANQHCKTHGGDMVWFVSKWEHQEVDEFLKNKNFLKVMSNNRWYHTGLHRKKKGSPLVWTRGLPVNYTGDPFTDQNELQFSSKAGTTKIDGDDSSVEVGVICRRF